MSTIRLLGCSTSVALATGPTDEEEVFDVVLIFVKHGVSSISVVSQLQLWHLRWLMAVPHVDQDKDIAKSYVALPARQLQALRVNSRSEVFVVCVFHEISLKTEPCSSLCVSLGVAFIS